MSTHMQEVKTVWNIQYTRNTMAYGQMADTAEQVARMLRELQKTGVKSVTLTEIRTCEALPGHRYTLSSVIDLEETIIGVAAFLGAK